MARVLFAKSLFMGKDRDVLPLLLDMHALSPNAILDVTYNKGTMWKGLRYPVTSMDIDPSFGTAIVGDFTALLDCRA